MKLYVGGLSFDTTDDGLRAFFEQTGTVESASVVTDRYSGRSRGFGFVEMATSAEGRKAIEELNGKTLDGRTISVDEARPPSREGGRGGFGGGGGAGRGGGDAGLLQHLLGLDLRENGAAFSLRAVYDVDDGQGFLLSGVERANDTPPLS